MEMNVRLTLYEFWLTSHVDILTHHNFDNWMFDMHKVLETRC